VGENGAVIGRASVERMTLGGGAHMNRIDSYTATPLSIVDTSGAELGRTAARIEGAGGVRLGPVGLGLALAYAPAETRTVAAPVPKVNISARPAVAGGVVWAPGEAFCVGAHARWRRTTQRIQHLAVTAGSRIYEFAGFHEPIPLDLTTHYSRRLETEVAGGGLSVGGEVLGSRWAIHAEADEFEEERWSGSTADEERDRWEGRGREAGLAVQRPWAVRSVAVLATGRVVWADFEGTAHHAERPDPVFDADTEVLRMHADLRLLHPAGWRGALIIGTTRSVETRRDRVAGATTDIRSWSPSLALELARDLPAGFAVGIAGAAGRYAPAGTLPDPDGMGAIYRAHLAPEHMLYGTPADTYAGEVTLRWTHPSGSFLWMRAHRASVGRGESTVTLPLSPREDRSGWGVSLGVELPGT
jgi:hypothetical protein